MTITLNGTTGITTPDVTSDGSLKIDASAPDDSLVVDASGDVGIGTSSPYKRLSATKASSTAYSASDFDIDSLALQLANTTNDKSTGIYFAIGSNGEAAISAVETSDGETALTFGTRGSGSRLERARIDSSGRTLIGITASRPNGGVLQVSAQGQTGLVTYTTSTANNNAAYFENGNGIVGTIATNGTSTSYNTSSDYRLKENWVAVADASTRVNALKPVNFAWITSGERVDGFLAHELAEVVPEAVSGEKDAMRDEEYEVTPAVLDADGAVVTPAVMGTRSVPNYQGIDQSKLVPLLTAALQEALAEITSLKSRLDAAGL